MDSQEYSERQEERDFGEKWKMGSKESSPATPANTPVEESEDKGFAEQVKNKLKHANLFDSQNMNIKTDQFSGVCSKCGDKRWQ